MKEIQNRGRKQQAETLFSEDLRRLLWRGPALALMAEQEGTWRAGLCWVLAEGLLRWITVSRTLPPPAVSLVVVGDARCPAHHVVVGVQIKDDGGQEHRWYLDANGVSTRATLLRYWREEERLIRPFLASYDEQLLLDLGIPRDGRMSTRVAECFLEAFGRFEPSFLDTGELFEGEGTSKTRDQHGYAHYAYGCSLASPRSSPGRSSHTDHPCAQAKTPGVGGNFCLS